MLQVMHTSSIHTYIHMHTYIHTTHTHTRHPHTQSRLEVMAMGTSDLTKDLRGKHVPSRSPLQYALEHCLMCARAYGLMALDGEHAHAQYMRWYKLCLYTYTLKVCIVGSGLRAWEDAR